MSEKKTQQLGMSPSTASNRLVKDLLWKSIVESNKTACCKCGKEMCRGTFSIEHLTPWLDSEDPVELYFDLNNIGYSHLKCNLADIRCWKKKFFTDEERAEGKRQQRERERLKRVYDADKRKERYERLGT